MGNDNSNMHTAKVAKNDEFYTRLEDIESELGNYNGKFRNKVVYCNCDDPVFFKGGRLDQKKSSQFITYFVGFFEALGLKKLICLGYKGEGKATAYIYNGDTNRNGIADESEWEVRPLEGNGDFRSEESIAFLKEADIVVTNPPFSLFREYVAQLVEYGKKFLIIGNMNAITYKEIFPLIKENKLWLGVGFNKSMCYTSPNKNTSAGNRKYVKAQGLNPDEYITVPAICWYTNLDNKNRHRPLLPDLICNKYTGNERNYPKYDTYDAINIDKVAKIPYDYTGVMGVPITFLGKYIPDEFEIIGIDRYVSDNPHYGHRFTINGTEIYARILIRRAKSSLKK